MMTAREEFRNYWPTLLAAFVGIALGIASIPFHVLGPLIKPLQSAFGWSYEGLLLCASLVAAGVTISSPLAGRLADKYEARRLVAISLIFLAGSYVAASQIRGALWQLQLLYFLMGLLGAGVGGIVLTRAVGERFHRARGLALGIVLCGSGASNFAAPLFVHGVVSTYGWPTVFLLLAAVTLCVALPITWFGLGSSRPAAGQADQPALVAPYGMTRSEALRDQRFFLLLATVILFGAVNASMVINTVPLLLSNGMGASEAAATASAMGIMTIVARLAVGSLLDRVRPSYVGIGIFLVGAAGVSLFLVGGVQYALVMVIALGFLMGAEIDLMAFLTLRYFGTRAYGEIFGIIFGSYTFMSIVSPAMGGLLIEGAGYRGLYLVALTVFLLASSLFVAMARLSDEKSLSPAH